MIGYVSYMLNLSTRYNAGNYLYYFLPGIAAGKILLFDELTKRQFTADQNSQEHELTERIRRLKDHWQFYRLDPESRKFDLKINIIIDNAEWPFTGFGTYSRFPYVKLYTIRKLFEQFFRKDQLNTMRFQYFVLKNRYADTDRFIAYIDENEGFFPGRHVVELGDIDADILHWPDYERIRPLVEKTYDLTGIIADAPLEGALRDTFSSDIEQIAGIIIDAMRSGQDSEKYLRFLEGRKAYLKKLFTENITTNKEVNLKDRKEQLIRKFFKTFSSVSYLRPGKDMLIRMPLDISSAASRIRSFEDLTAMLVESVDFFRQEDHIEFLSGGAKKQVFEIKEIEYDEAIKNDLFGDYVMFKEQNLPDLREQKRDVKFYKFNDEIDPSEFLKIDKMKLDAFIHAGYADKDVGWFYSEKAVENFRKKLESNSLDEMEDDIRMKLDKLNLAYLLEGDYGIGTGTRHQNYTEIQHSLDELKTEQEKEKVVSRVDYEAYQESKRQYKERIPGLHRAFLDAFKLLPTLGATFFSVVALILLFYLLIAPLYRFEYWNKSWPTVGLFALILILGVAGILYFLRGRILSFFDEIIAENKKLVGAFDQYVESLKELARRVRQSTLRRLNIKVLETELEKIRKQEQQQIAYKEFYEGIVRQLKRNGYSITKPDKSPPPPAYHIPPERDPRITTEREIISFIIDRNGNQSTYPKENEPFVAVLGVIKKLKIK